MRLRRVQLVLLATIAVSLTLGWGLWNSKQSVKERSRKLPDGSTVVLQRVTYDKAYSMRTGNRLRDYLVPILPTLWARKLDCQFMTSGCSNSLTFWLLGDGITFARAAPLQATTFDEHGCEFQSRDGFGFSRSILVCSFTDFPRRAKEVGFRLYQSTTNGAWSAIAEYSVPNPDKRTYPILKPELLPATKSAGNFDFTLLEAKPGVGARFVPAPPAKPLGFAAGSFKFRITKHGRPISNWSPWGVGVTRYSSAALGQTETGGFGWENAGPGEYVLTLLDRICSEDSAWKMEVRFQKEGDSTDDEVWTVKGVPLPQPSTASLVNLATNLDGAQIRFVGIIGKEQADPWMKQMCDEWPVLHLIATGLVDDLDFINVRIVDDRGRDVRGTVLPGSARLKHPDWFVGLKPHPDSKNVDLSFGIFKRVSASYLVQPARLKTVGLKN